MILYALVLLVIFIFVFGLRITFLVTRKIFTFSNPSDNIFKFTKRRLTDLCIALYIGNWMEFFTTIFTIIFVYTSIIKCFFSIRITDLDIRIMQ